MRFRGAQELPAGNARGRGVRAPFLLVSGLAVLLLAWGLAEAPGVAMTLLSGRLAGSSGPGSVDLLELARKQGVGPPAGDDLKRFIHRFSRGGVRLEAVILTPGALLELPLPDQGGPACVSLRVGMPFNLGDGARLEVQAVRPGSETLLLNRSLDPAHVRADRAWIPVDFQFGPGQLPPTLRFRVSEGDSGDHTGDWVGIAPGEKPGCLFSKAN